MTVHVYREVELQEDEHELISALHDMVSKYESPDSSYSLQDVDAEFLACMNKGVQGFKIKINKIAGKAKLSQYHPLQRQELILITAPGGIDQMVLLAVNAEVSLVSMFQMFRLLFIFVLIMPLMKMFYRWREKKEIVYNQESSVRKRLCVLKRLLYMDCSLP